MKPRFLEQLENYDNALGRTPLRAEADQRIRRALRGGAAPARAMPGWGWPALAATAALTVWVVIADWGNESEMPAVSLAPSCEVRAEHPGATEYLGVCDLRMPQMQIKTEARTRLRDNGGLVQVVYGTAHFDVAPVAAGDPPVEVRVTGGVIRVLGTRFDVVQTEGQGSVRLFSGRIAFEAPGQTPVTLAPGEHLTWDPPADEPAAVEDPELEATEPTEPTPTEPAPIAPAPTEPEAPSRSAPVVSSNEPSARASTRSGVREVMRLRSLGRYAEALGTLQELEQSFTDPRSREVLSFEKGKLLERLHGKDAACRHWQAHGRRYPRGRYRAAVEEERKVCAKETTPRPVGE